MSSSRSELVSHLVRMSVRVQGVFFSLKVLMVFQESFKCISRISKIFQGSLICVSMCFKEVSRLFHEFFKDVSRVFQGCFKGISSMVQYSKIVTRVFLGILKGSFQGALSQFIWISMGIRGEGIKKFYSDLANQLFSFLLLH